MANVVDNRVQFSGCSRSTGLKGRQHPAFGVPQDVGRHSGGHTLSFVVENARVWTGLFEERCLFGLHPVLNGFEGRVRQGDFHEFFKHFGEFGVEVVDRKIGDESFATVQEILFVGGFLGSSIFVHLHIVVIELLAGGFQVHDLDWLVLIRTIVILLATIAHRGQHFREPKRVVGRFQNVEQHPQFKRFVPHRCRTHQENPALRRSSKRGHNGIGIFLGRVPCVFGGDQVLCFVNHHQGVVEEGIGVAVGLVGAVG